MDKETQVSPGLVVPSLHSKDFNSKSPFFKANFKSHTAVNKVFNAINSHLHKWQQIRVQFFNFELLFNYVLYGVFF